MPEHGQFVDLARSSLASGAGHDEVLALLRRRGLSKMACIRVMRETGLGLGEAKRMVHESSVWADRREADEAAEEWVWHSMFVLAVLGEADVDAPAEQVAECAERRQRATARMGAVAAGLPDVVLHRYRELLDEGLVGRAFAVLVAVVREHGAECWAELAAVADTLLLEGGEDTGGDSEDWAHAAWEVRRRLSGEVPQ